MGIQPVCPYCFKSVSREGLVHTECRRKKDFIDNIDDPAKDDEGGDNYGRTDDYHNY